MGVENAEDAATWKPNNRILRRQKKLLPLPKEKMEGEEEDTISSIIYTYCVNCFADDEMDSAFSVPSPCS